jgi:DNA processing protein
MCPQKEVSGMLIDWLILDGVKGLGPVGIAALLDHFGSVESLLGCPDSELIRRVKLNEKIITQFKSAALRERAQQQIEAAQQCGVTILTPDTPRYPALLKEIGAPPPVLYARGNFDAFDNHAVGVVGTRTPTLYGKNAVCSLTKGLVQHNLAIVSGLARGIDSMAHQTCVENGGVTIAVLGCGLDIALNRPSTELVERIVPRGAVVSEFALGTHPEAFNFPRRNRIISGLSAGVVVVEAGERSGSLITANYALNQGREVMAVPGSIFSDRSIGTHKLIRSGAVPIRCAQEVVNCIATPQLGGLSAQRSPSNQEFDLTLLNEGERRIYELIGTSPQRIDELSRSGAISLEELFSVLLSLELKGAIEQIAGQLYVRASS